MKVAINLVRQIVLAVAPIVALVVLSETPIALDTCPVSALGQPTQTCAKPLTGCLCVLTFMGGTGAYPDCGGCYYTVSGTLDCTYSTHPPTSTPVAWSGGLTCGSSTQLGAKCPCTGQNYFPFLIECGTCP
jgi:hypothetical protein